MEIFNQIFSKFIYVDYQLICFFLSIFFLITLIYLLLKSNLLKKSQ
jgi:hypothetical protein